VRYFAPEKWELRPFGHYIAPIDVFPGRYQRQLSEIFRRAPAIDFGVGYRWRLHESNLLLAEKKALAKLHRGPGQGRCRLRTSRSIVARWPWRLTSRTEGRPDCFGASRFKPPRSRYLREREITFSTSLQGNLRRGSVTFLATADARHNDFITHAWVDSPIQDLLKRI